MAQVATRPHSQPNGSPHSYRPANMDSSAASPRSLSHSAPKSSLHNNNNNNNNISPNSSPSKKKKKNKHLLQQQQQQQGQDTKQPAETSDDPIQSTLKQRGMLHALLADPVRFVKSHDSHGQDYTSMGIVPVNDPNYSLSKSKSKPTSKVSLATSLLLHTDTPAINGLSASTSDQAGPSSRPASPTKPKRQPDFDLYPHKISLRFPAKVRHIAPGLSNYGNTCYMNSVMQSLIHTPPLAFALLSNDISALHGEWGGKPNPTFDPVLAMQKFARRSLLLNGANTNAPADFNRNLKAFAKPLRQGRQEDAHEYLRFLLEAMQQCCLARAPKSLKQDHPARQTTFIQKIFGGKLRSRVTCLNCNHNSDTFDPILDISLDMHKGISSLTDAFRAFVKKDTLSGTEKYKCDSCKRKVNATKQFTIENAPLALTVHLKRFGPFGGKISRPIAFDDTLNIGPYMSNRSQSARYRLYAVVHHYGSGPNSGHYVASVKSPSNRWTRMDDSHVSEMHNQTPAGDQSAYILFYLREKDESLQSAINSVAATASATASATPSATPSEPGFVQPSPKTANGLLPAKKRKLSEETRASSLSPKKAKFHSSHEPSPSSRMPLTPSSAASGSPRVLPSSKTASRDSLDDGDELGTTVSRGDYESLIGGGGGSANGRRASVSSHRSSSPAASDASPALSKKARRKQAKAEARRAGGGAPSSPFALANMSTSLKKGGGQPGMFAGKMKPRHF